MTAIVADSLSATTKVTLNGKACVVGSYLAPGTLSSVDCSAAAQSLLDLNTSTAALRLDDGGITGDFSVSLLADPDPGLAFAEVNITLSKGSSRSVVPISRSSSTITYTKTSGASGITVDSAGLVRVEATATSGDKATITASQVAIPGEYAADSTSYTVTVTDLKQPVVSFDTASPAAVTYGSLPATINAARCAKAAGDTGTYIGSAIYAVDNNKASIDSRTGALTAIKQAGTVVVTATCPAAAGYTSATASYNLTVNKASPTVNFDVSALALTFGATGVTRALTVAAINSGSSSSNCGGACAAPAITDSIAISYSSSNAAVATVASNGLIQAVGVGDTTSDKGSATITASWPGDSNYTEVRKTVTVTVSRAANTLSSSPSLTLKVGRSGSMVLSGKNSSGAISYSKTGDSSITLDAATGTVTVAANALTSHRATITAIQAQTAQHLGKTVSYTVEVSTTLDQPKVSFSNPTPAAISYGTLPATNPATCAAADLGATYSGSPSYSATNATVSNTGANKGAITAINGAGTVTVTAACPEATGYTSTSTSYTLTVSKASAVLSFSNASVTLTYPGSNTQALSLAKCSGCVSGTAAPSGTVEYTTGNGNIATVDPSSGAVTAAGAGSTTITATYAGDANYQRRSQSYGVTVNRGSTTLAFAKASLDLLVGGSDSNVATSSASNGRISYSSSNPTVATVDDNGLVSAKTTGTATITASQAATSQYNAPANVSYTVNVVLTRDLAGVIALGTIPSDLASYDALTRSLLAFYPAGAAVVARYVTPDGGTTTKDGTSWDKAWAAADLKDLANKLSDAADNKVYLLLLKAGEYKAGAAFAMKNNVAIVGGFSGTAFSRSGSTTLSGNDSYRVVSNNNGLTAKALLYGATIAKGNSDSGGGMHNEGASPTLIQVTFTGNTASSSNGGGMLNSNSSPTLIQVTFTGNTASINGGGMYNSNSSPTLIQVTFTGNTATNVAGGGMFNTLSSPTLVNSILWGNTANFLPQYEGGGSINYSIVQDGQTATATVTGAVNAGSTSPLVSAGLADNGGSVRTVALAPSTPTSTPAYTNPAINAGLYVKAKMSSTGTYTFYSSKEGSTWYSSLTGSGTTATPPTDAIDLTATDARGYARVGAPDIGAYEVQ